MFSDGLSNYGDSQIQLSSKPVSIINSARVANHSYLEYIAQAAAGQYINLNNLTINAALELMTEEKLQLTKAKYNKNKISEVFIKNNEDISRFSLVGKLTAKSANVVLHFGYSNKKDVYTRKISINNRGDLSSNQVERYWAQQKLNFLNINYKRNRDKITLFGKKYGFVTQ